MDVTIVNFSDWVAIYKDGELVVENHSLRPDEVLFALGIGYNTKYIEDDESLDFLPRKLEELND